MRAWVEIVITLINPVLMLVALHVRAWVEIEGGSKMIGIGMVALHVRAWVEIQQIIDGMEGVLESPFT